MSELQLRVISAIVMAVLAIGSTWIGGGVFVAVWAVLSLLVLQEWFSITRNKPDFWAWGLGGILYATALFFSVVALRLEYGVTSGAAPPASGTAYGAGFGLIAMLFLFAVVWASDVCAYFAGRTFGGPKLAPRISPNKTWSGFGGGILGGVLGGLFVLWIFGLGTPGIHHAGLAALLSLASIFGDLFESAFKRRFRVKDSGRIIPGHGGVMDRLDGFIFAAVAAAIIGISIGGVAFAARGLLLLK